MHFFYNYDKALQNIHKKLRHGGKIIITDFWEKEAFVIFLKKCEINNLKIVSIEDQTKNTVESMKKDISETFLKFKNKINEDSLSAFIEIQKERLQVFEENENRHYKFIIEKI